MNQLFSLKNTKLYLIILLLGIFFTARSQDSILIQGKRYKVDTLTYKHDIGLGTMHTYYSLPDMPLLVNVLEIDYTNPYVKIETCLSNDSLKQLEKPSLMAKRKSYEGHKVFATINGDFYNTQHPNIGIPINGQILKGEIAKEPINNRGVITIDKNKHINIGYKDFSGTITFNNRTIVINGINRTRNNNELILYNKYNGKTSKTNDYGTEVIASLISSKWDVNKTLQLKVEEVIEDKGSNEINDGKIILSGHLAASDFLKNLSSGDVLEIQLNIKDVQAAQDNHQYQEMIGGGRIILKNGIPSNDVWVIQHPRTAVGFTSDNKKLILVVVDGRSRESRGVGTEELTDILKLSGAYTALNLDGGGSSVMVVRDKITNTPSDGNERSVGNALQIISTAIPKNPKTFKLSRKKLNVNFGDSYQVNCSSFDENGEVVNYLNFNKVKYIIKGDVGTIDSTGLFIANGNNKNGVIVASWNGIEDSIKVSISHPNQFKLSFDTLVIDNRHNYQFIVNGFDTDNKSYIIENNILDFELLNNSIGHINENGTFTGSNNGVSKIIVKSPTLGIADTSVIFVETGINKILLDDFSDITSWDLSKSWINNISTSREVHPDLNKEMLRIDYSLKYAYKTASISLKKYIEMYGMPDSLLLKSINNGYPTTYYLVIDHPQGLTKTEKFTDTTYFDRYTKIDTENIDQEEYRLSFNELRINLEKSSNYNEGSIYEGTFWIDQLFAVYPTKDYFSTSLIDEEIPKIKIYPNPVKKSFNIEADELKGKKIEVNIYNSSGSILLKEKLLFNNVGCASIQLNKHFVKGIYIIEINSKRKKFIKKLMVQ